MGRFFFLFISSAGVLELNSIIITGIFTVA